MNPILNSESDNMQESQGRVIYNFIPIERNLCIKWNELKELLNYYPYGHRHRVAFAIMACTGLRGCEVVSLLMNCFSPDCASFRYSIKKFRPKTYETGTTVYNVKTRGCTLPAVVAKEVKWYVEHNYHLFQNGRIFPFDVSSLRRYLCKLRVRAKKGLLSPTLAQALLDTTKDSICIGAQLNSCYRIGLHSFRRFYLTYRFHTDWEKNLAIACRSIGHELKETTMTYLYLPENIGLNDALKEKQQGFEGLFCAQNQRRIDDYT
jgi:integrase